MKLKATVKRISNKLSIKTNLTFSSNVIQTVEDEQDQEDDFSMIKVYFSEELWKSMAPLEKLRNKIIYDRYQYMKKLS